MRYILLALLLVSVILYLESNYVYAETKNIQFYRNIEAEVTYPNGVVLGEKFIVSFLIENKVNFEKQNIIISLDGSPSFSPVEDTTFHIPILAGSGHFGKTLDFRVSDNATTGIQYFNINFTTGELSDSFYNTVLAIQITDEPQVIIKTITPNSIFTDAEFPFEVIIESQGSDITDVTLQIIPPEEITFRGEKQHTFSSIQKNNPLSIMAELITTGHGEVDTQHFLPFTITVSYTDEFEEQRIESKTLSLLLRPRTFFEWGPNAGLWIGDFYLAPTISIGTIIGPPIGLLLTIWYRRHKQKKLF